MREEVVNIFIAGDFHAISPESIKLSTKFKELLKIGDIKVLNFEGSLPLGNLTIPNKTILKQSFSSPAWCEKNGFNVISLANNHAYDYGAKGLRATINSFKQSVLVGAGKWDEAYQIKYIDIHNIKIGFLAASAADLASLKDKWTDVEKIGCAWINSSEVDRLIRNAKNKCDFLFVLPHAGVEYMDVPLPEWRDRYRELIDIGADGVIASHPHVPQGVELYKEKPIFYSLGNLFFDKGEKNNNKKYWNNGLVALLEIKNNKITYKCYPTIKTGNLLDVDNSVEMVEHFNFISEILKDDQKYMEHVNKDVLYFYDIYKNRLLAGFNAKEINLHLKNLYGIIRSLLFSRPNLKSALHQIREESTRWTIARALKLKSNTDL